MKRIVSIANACPRTKAQKQPLDIEPWQEGHHFRSSVPQSHQKRRYVERKKKSDTRKQDVQCGALSPTVIHGEIDMKNDKRALTQTAIGESVE